MIRDVNIRQENVIFCIDIRQDFCHNLGMYRDIYKDLIKWKNSKNRKPLILSGARQVGKTWIIKEFGKNEYKNVAYINCDNNQLVKDLFKDFDLNRILLNISAITEQRIIPGETLIIFDEVGELPLAITSLKYFCEQLPEHHIIVSGSLLGIKLHEGTGFPVGKVNRLNLYPMNFKEFLLAFKKDNLVYLLEEDYKGKWDDINKYNNLLNDLLKQYLFVGGMPEVVNYYKETKDLIETRKLQEAIINDYRDDISKHAPKSIITKVNALYSSIPSQLSKENKKFIYALIKKGARAREYEDALEWLIDAGIVHKLNRVNKITKPLTFYEDTSAFKIYLNDLGLLGAMCNTKARDVIVENKVFEEYKGAFCEQYVFQQLLSNNKHTYYYTNNDSTLEINFLLELDDLYAIEVKSGFNTKSKSLKSVMSKDENLLGLRFSLNEYKSSNRISDVPLSCVIFYISKLTS